MDTRGFIFHSKNPINVLLFSSFLVLSLVRSDCGGDNPRDAGGSESVTLDRAGIGTCNVKATFGQCIDYVGVTQEYATVDCPNGPWAIPAGEATYQHGAVCEKTNRVGTCWNSKGFLRLYSPNYSNTAFAENYCAHTCFGSWYPGLTADDPKKLKELIEHGLAENLSLLDDDLDLY